MTTKTYQITSKIGGEDLGTFAGATAVEAWQASAREAGYTIDDSGESTVESNADGEPMASFAEVTMRESSYVTEPGGYRWRRPTSEDRSVGTPAKWSSTIVELTSGEYASLSGEAADGVGFRFGRVYPTREDAERAKIAIALGPNATAAEVDRLMNNRDA